MFTLSTFNISMRFYYMFEKIGNIIKAGMWMIYLRYGSNVCVPTSRWCTSLED